MTKLTTVGSKKVVEPNVVNGEILLSTKKRGNFDQVAADVCPHDNAALLPPIRTTGTGEKAVCTQCGHTWYINRKIRTCKCLTCSADKQKAKIVTNAGDVKNVANKSGGSAWESNPPKTLLMPPDGFEVRSSRQPALLIENFIKSRRAGLSPRTIDNYRLYLRHAGEVVGLNVTGDDIQRFIASRQCSGGGRHAYFRCLRAFYNWLYSRKSGYKLNREANPILDADAPIVEKKILPSLTTEQVEILINKAECIRDKAIISLFADSGLRLIELANIEPHNIDWKNRLIKVKCKGNKEAYAPFGERTEKLLREWLSQYNANGRLWDINHNMIAWTLQQLKHDTGLPCNPHTFRRTFASILAKRGVDSLHIMRLGRWESMAMVERYTRSVKFEDSLKLYAPIVN